MRNGERGELHVHRPDAERRLRKQKSNGLRCKMGERGEGREREEKERERERERRRKMEGQKGR